MYKTILHATDLYDNHFELCAKAYRFAEQNKAQLYFLHAIEIPLSLQWAQTLGFSEIPPPSTDNAEIVMKTLADAFKMDASHFKVVIGNASKHILDMSQTLHCDLIILGSHQSDLLNIAGSTTNAVIHHALCDVLVFKSG